MKSTLMVFGRWCQ